MKNLRGDELKKSIKLNILYALDHKKQPAEIVFKFICSPKDRFREKITIFGGVYFRDISFGQFTPYVMDIILNNMNYDCFALIDTEEKHGQPECHGHGEYWGTDKFIFTYYRLPEEEENEKDNHN